MMCFLPPLFNYYLEAIFKEALRNSGNGININGRIKNNMWYADNTLIVMTVAMNTFFKFSFHHLLMMDYKTYVDN